MTEIPQTAPDFKAWSDLKCVNWPSWLQAQAYRAWRYLDVMAVNDKQIFDEQFKKWEAEQKPPVVEH